jgi:hypothetical protein
LNGSHEKDLIGKLSRKRNALSNKAGAPTFLYVNTLIIAVSYSTCSC